MTATLTDRKQSYTKSHDRDSGFYWEYRVLDLETLTEPVRVRLFWPANIVYCVVRAGIHQGSGRAGGGGHKVSAALGYAISNAGIDLSESIDGAGDRAMHEAILAIATALGVSKPHLISVCA